MMNCNFIEISYKIVFMKKTSRGQNSLRQNYFKLYFEM